jgi:hypothetical protein
MCHFSGVSSFFILFYSYVHTIFGSFSPPSPLKGGQSDLLEMDLLVLSGEYASILASLGKKTGEIKIQYVYFNLLSICSM